MPDKEIVVKMVVSEPPVPEPNTLYLICPASGPSVILLNGLRLEQGSWESLLGKPTVIAAGETVTAARAAIQAGAESATITDSTEDKTLVAAGNWGLWSLLQRFRNFQKWVVGRFDASGKALSAVNADSATTANTANSATTANTATSATSAATATKLVTPRALTASLSNTGVGSFDGAADTTIGVSGTLGVVNGGTGATTAAAALTNLGGATNAQTLTDAAATTVLPPITVSTVPAILQSVRNTLKWLISRFDGAGKALTAVAADSAASASTSVKLTTPRSLRVDLASSSAVNFDGTANVTPGVTGVLPVGNGGTGSNTAAAARTALGVPAATNGTHTGTTAMDLVSLKAVRSKSTNQVGNATIDMSLGEHFTLTPVGNFTLAVTSPPPAGQIGVFILDINNGGSYTITWPANSRWENGTIQALTATGRDRLAFTTVDGGTSYEISMLLKNFK